MTSCYRVSTAVLVKEFANDYFIAMNVLKCLVIYLAKFYLWTLHLLTCVLSGPDGRPGLDGLPGVKGDFGLAGLEGTPGPRGLTGTRGTKGQDGLPGLPGQKGSNGFEGRPGTSGLKGENNILVFFRYFFRSPVLKHWTTQLYT